MAGHSAGAEDVLAALLPALDRWLAAEPADVLSAWRERDALLGERVRWAEGEGIAGGIDHSGSLIVEVHGERRVLGAGEVHLLR